MRRAVIAAVGSLCLASLAGCEDGVPAPPAPQFKEPFHLNGYELQFGYSQAVKVGRTLYVSATMAVDSDGRLVAPGDLGGQMDAVYANLARTLAAHGARLDDVVLERVYVTDMARFLEVADRRFRFHSPGALPAMTLVQVQRLVDPGFLVAIEAVVELPEAAAGPGTRPSRDASG
jgi:enamine deaminase RidA (YjgF/YER057c/UK114 family)